MELSVVQHIISLFQQEHPWITDKLGSAVVSQGIKEIWERVKDKLGSDDVKKVEGEENDSVQWEVLKSKLIIAIEADESFRDQLCRLLSQRAQQSAGIVQRAEGPANTQIAVDRSQDIKIRVK